VNFNPLRLCRPNSRWPLSANRTAASSAPPTQTDRPQRLVAHHDKPRDCGPKPPDGPWCTFTLPLVKLVLVHGETTPATSAALELLDRAFCLDGKFVGVYQMLGVDAAGRVLAPHIVPVERGSGAILHYQLNDHLCPLAFPLESVQEVQALPCPGTVLPRSIVHRPGQRARRR
jgi:hypothetical protein